jgi:hypothetical protein
VFSEPLPSNGHGADHVKTLLAVPYILLCARIREWPRNGCACHNMLVQKCEQTGAKKRKHTKNIILETEYGK